MTEARTQMERLRPASPEAVAMARGWAQRAYADEAEAMLALELVIEAAMEAGRAQVRAADDHPNACDEARR